jgi:hypothetical protein
MYSIALLNDPPRPTYPQYDAVEALARQITPAFVDPANLRPESEVTRRRGNDWCTAVLGRPYGWTTRISVHEQYLLIAADQLAVDPPLPDWIVEGRRLAADAEAQRNRWIEDARQRDRDAWAAVLADATVEFDVHHGSRARVRGALNENLRHAVPRADAYSGARKVRTHRRGRALCETPTRFRPLDISDTPAPAGTPATCVRCLEWVPKVRQAESPAT